jgi:aldehyde:ferredoxin oxidoreductase
MAALDVPLLVTWTNCVTGWDMDAAEFLRVGERNFNLKRLLNLSCGLTGADDTLPHRFTDEPFQSGGSAGSVPDLPKMLNEYYEFRGWGKDGVPSESKLKELGLIPIAETRTSLINRVRASLVALWRCSADLRMCRCVAVGN